MIYDCFNFYNELELLDIRLNTLAPVVDKFILAEATVTHTNQPKPLYYGENKSKFKKFKDKIIHVVIKDSPPVNVPWIIINHQMSVITRGFEVSKPKPNDTILVSCVDEIPKPERILQWKDNPAKHKVFLQNFSYYYLNCFDITTDGRWDGTRMFSYKNLMTYPSPYVARFTKPDLLIPDGGWHFSYMGGIKRMQEKLSTLAHQEYNNDKFNTAEHIRLSFLERKDFLDHGRKFKIVDVSLLPEYVQKNQSKFKALIAKKSDHEPSFYIERTYLVIKKFLRLIYRKVRRWYWREKDFFNEQE